MTEHTINISAVVWREGDTWVAQGVEYDIVAHATDVLKLPQAFADAVVENACITMHLGRQPLEGIDEAPQRFRRMFDEASGTALSLVPSIARDASMPTPAIDLRVVDHA